MASSTRQIVLLFAAAVLLFTTCRAAPIVKRQSTNESDALANYALGLIIGAHIAVSYYNRRFLWNTVTMYMESLFSSLECLNCWSPHKSLGKSLRVRHWCSPDRLYSPLWPRQHWRSLTQRLCWRLDYTNFWESPRRHLWIAQGRSWSLCF